MNNEKTKVITSVVMPIRNEERYIGKCIETLLKQDYSKENMEYIFIDGASTDDTKRILYQYKDKYPNLIKILDNPNKTVPYAMNLGIKSALGKYIVRLDAHCEYEYDYISQCIYYLENTDADNVGGPTVAKAKNLMQEIVSVAYHSRFALGGGRCHEENYEGYADTVAFGAFKKETLIEVGLYDEKFTRNQDDELNFRLIESGKKIFITPKIKFYYYPRDKYSKLFSQYYQYGWWKVEVLRKHGKPARLTHLIPGLFVTFVTLGLPLAMLNQIFLYFYSSVLSLYFLILMGVTFSTQKLKKIKNKIRLAYVIFILHISYGLGFIAGSLKILKR